MAGIDIRTQIIEAAEQRFTQYGYGKTTMAEIAQDCGMSAANLYRYFKNKLDIGKAIASLFLAKKERGLALIVADQNLLCVEKLQTFILYVLHDTYYYFDKRPRLSELVERITMSHPETLETHSHSTVILLKQLLDNGLQTGEFDFIDSDQTADAINTAIAAFYIPSVMPLYSLEVFEEKARTVCKLLLNGLAKN